jgi:uncharacterized protein
MADHDFEASIVDQTAHRPWPLPDGPWVMSQTWHDLLFAHWPLAAEPVRAKVPGRFELDVFEGQAWLGIVPFRMTNVAPRGVPALPWISEFPELNVRTYVRVGDRPGIYFFSLDAGSVLAVKAARALLNLPYHAAEMTVTPGVSEIDYRSRRTSAPSARLETTYQPVGPAFNAAPGTLEHFLTERYCLYHLDHGGAPYRLDIHHPPWSLQPAEATFRHNTMAAVNELSIGKEPPLLHFARRQDMVAWSPTQLGA